MAWAYADEMTDRSRTLVLLRHAKSAYPPGVGDHARPLAARGIREATLAGDWLRSAAGPDPAVQAVLCSTATRTRQTLERTGIEAPVSFIDDLYDATPVRSSKPSTGSATTASAWTRSPCWWSATSRPCRRPR